MTLAGNVHPLARAASSSATVDLSTSMAHMILNLKGSAAQEAALDQLIAAQNNPKSPLYHRYLTPQSFAAQFGAAPSDIAKITAWLESHGMHVEQVPAGNRALIFSGTAAQVNDAFQTEIRRYKVAGASHYANATDPKIPAALAGAIGGVVKLHDFRHGSNISMSKVLRAADPTSPHYTSGSAHYLTPADYSIIYDINPVYTAGINGTGQAIAVIARSDIYLSDVQTFRSTFGIESQQSAVYCDQQRPRRAKRRQRGNHSGYRMVGRSGSRRSRQGHHFFFRGTLDEVSYPVVAVRRKQQRGAYHHLELWILRGRHGRL